MMKRLRITVCALLVLMLLAGCAGSPSFMNTKQASSANDYAWEEEAPMMAEPGGGVAHCSPPNRLRLPSCRRRL